MARYRVKGLHRETGEPIDLTIDAQDAKSAQLKANEMGFVVETVSATYSGASVSNSAARTDQPPEQSHAFPSRNANSNDLNTKPSQSPRRLPTGQLFLAALGLVFALVTLINGPLFLSPDSIDISSNENALAGPNNAHSRVRGDLRRAEQQLRSLRGSLIRQKNHVRAMERERAVLELGLRADHAHLKQDLLNLGVDRSELPEYQGLKDQGFPVAENTKREIESLERQIQVQEERVAELSRELRTASQDIEFKSDDRNTDKARGIEAIAGFIAFLLFGLSASVCMWRKR